MPGPCPDRLQSPRPMPSLLVPGLRREVQPDDVGRERERNRDALSGGPLAGAPGRVSSSLVFWRTHAGAEVDLLIVDGRRIHPIEIKLGAAVDPRSLAGLRQCMADLSLMRGFVITTGEERRSIGKAIEILPWRSVARGEVDIA